jgi:hypothetical protein
MGLKKKKKNYKFSFFIFFYYKIKNEFICSFFQITAKTKKNMKIINKETYILDSLEEPSLHKPIGL